MFSSIANFKENLNKIVLDVHESDEELEIYASDRRISHAFAHSNSFLNSSVSNGIDSPRNSEIERYEAEVKRLQQSEAEIKALSVNYAALLKEKEERLSRLNEENGSLRKSLDSVTAVASSSRNEMNRTSTNSLHSPKGNGDHLSNRQHKLTSQIKNRSTGLQIHNGVASRHDGFSNGITHTVQSEPKYSNIQGNERELADLLEEKNRSFAAAQATKEAQIKELRLELDKERDKLAKIQLELDEEHKGKESVFEELNSLKKEKEKTSIEMNEIQNELNEKISEIRRLQRREHEEAVNDVTNLKILITTLEKENTKLKGEKDELEGALERARTSSNGKIFPDALETSQEHSRTSNEGGNSSEVFPGKEELELSLQKLENELREVRKERDKALKGLNRLKQHLLDKEREESEKMDEDSKTIEELRAKNEYQKLQILHLEKALKQAVASQEDIKMMNSTELQKSKEMIGDLNKKLASCMSTIDAKNVELLNLQTALGQYYAEIEAKEHLEGDLALAREESAKLAKLLKDAHQQLELSNREKEEIMGNLSQAESLLAEGKRTVIKLEEDNGKVRRALEQSMTRLNRMSMDSDYFVDRRIVIKLLVTYFQRNHSKEVLDLMVRMLGFSEEDKQRIGVAQQGAATGVVRGVLGLPGRLVGGFIGGNAAGNSAGMASENQSFADMWVDFLLKETEERERRESGDVLATPKGRSKNAAPSFSSTPGATSGFSRPPVDQNQSPITTRRIPNSELSDSEFSTVPLTSSDSTSRLSRLLQKY